MRTVGIIRGLGPETTSKGVENYLPYLVDAAQRLEKGGADFIVIPCNSVHLLIADVRKSSKSIYCRGKSPLRNEGYGDITPKI